MLPNLHIPASHRVLSTHARHPRPSFRIPAVFTPLSHDCSFVLSLSPSLRSSHPDLSSSDLRPFTVAQPISSRHFIVLSTIFIPTIPSASLGTSSSPPTPIALTPSCHHLRHLHHLCPFFLLVLQLPFHATRLHALQLSSPLGTHSHTVIPIPPAFHSSSSTGPFCCPFGTEPPEAALRRLSATARGHFRPNQRIAPKS
ncbi:hypothetical protein R3P38DRAFT_3191670 [Favolaschia claudopus]|uniref:Uncharacterized protein n=1 Tax=Favolaschia claudopus TaxID=2862362 RepID=A0AAW0BJR0_9AGAR